MKNRLTVEPSNRNTLEAQAYPLPHRLNKAHYVIEKDSTTDDSNQWERHLSHTVKPMSSRHGAPMQKILHRYLSRLFVSITDSNGWRTRRRGGYARGEKPARGVKVSKFAPGVFVVGSSFGALSADVTAGRAGRARTPLAPLSCSRQLTIGRRNRVYFPARTRTFAGTSPARDSDGHMRRSRRFRRTVWQPQHSTIWKARS